MSNDFARIVLKPIGTSDEALAAAGKQSPASMRAAWIMHKPYYGVEHDVCFPCLHSIVWGLLRRRSRQVVTTPRKDVTHGACYPEEYRGL